MAKLDIGSGPKDYWVSTDPDWWHLDKEEYDGVIRWKCPERLPVSNKEVEEAYIGQLLVSLTVGEQIELAKELVRVMKDDGLIRVHCYDGVLGHVEFFEELDRNGWIILTEELINYIEGECKTYMVEIKKLGGE